MENPIVAVENAIAGEIAKVKSWAAREIQRAKIEVKIEVCEEGIEALQAQIVGLKAEFAKLNAA